MKKSKGVLNRLNVCNNADDYETYCHSITSHFNTEKKSLKKKNFHYDVDDCKICCHAIKSLFNTEKEINEEKTTFAITQTNMKLAVMLQRVILTQKKKSMKNKKLSL